MPADVASGRAVLPADAAFGHPGRAVPGLGQDHGADVGIPAGQQQLPVLSGGQQAQLQGQAAVCAAQKEGLVSFHRQSMLQMPRKGKPEAGIRLTQSPVKG